LAYILCHISSIFNLQSSIFNLQSSIFNPRSSIRLTYDACRSVHLRNLYFFHLDSIRRPIDFFKFLKS
jgi:hypothetical protein